MKKILTILLCVVTACGMTSCLGDDNETYLTDENVTEAMNTMRGTYEGNLLYALSSTDVPDTVRNIRWTVDSVLTIHNFPQRIFAESFSNMADSKMVADIRALPPRDLKCHIGFYSIGDGGYMLNIIPETLQFKATVNEQKTDCKIEFLSNNENSIGVFQKSNRSLIFMMNTYGFYLNGNMVNGALFNRTYFKLITNAKN
ncbi:MAG: DUF4840 domain-containing protein [Prevotella sp.]|jgi:hypothetical protein